jgi:hypothetical protein
MESVENLKLNVSNIKSVLTTSNKNLKQLQIKKTSILRKQIQGEKRFEREKKIETPRIPGSELAKGIVRKIASPVMGVFDRIMGFFSAILLGFVVNNLPKIIAELTPIFETMKPIYEGFMKGLGFVINGIGFLYNSVAPLFFNENEARNNIKTAEDTLKLIDKDLDEGFELSKDNDNTESETTQTQEVNNYTDPSTPVIQQQTQVKPEIQKRNTGGLVNKRQNANLPPRRNNYENAKTNPLRLFGKVTEQNSENVNLFEKNNDKLEEIAKLLKSSERKKSITTNDNKPATDNKVVISDGKITGQIVGRVGHSGYTIPEGPEGSHIHIETGRGEGGAGGEIPSSVLSNIIVGGKPLSDWPQTSTIGDGRGHRGLDYGIPKGTPITLKGGLKLVDYDTVRDPSGYGNNIVIVDKYGNYYLIAHLSSGPEKSKDGEGGQLNNSITSRQIIPLSDEIKKQIIIVPVEKLVPIETPVPVTGNSTKVYRPGGGKDYGGRPLNPWQTRGPQ